MTNMKATETKVIMREDIDLDAMLDDAAIAMQRVSAAGRDTKALTHEERVATLSALSKALGLNPLTNPVQFLSLSGREVLYVTKQATDQIAARLRLNRETVAGPEVRDFGGTKLVFCQVKVTAPDGRSEVSTATLPFTDPVNVLMKCETKAKRRATLSLAGLGLLTEEEMETIPGAQPSPAVDLAAIGIERNIGTPAPRLPPAVSFVEEIGDADCVTLRDVRNVYAMHARPGMDTRAMVDDVRAWLAERGIPGVTGAEASAILSTLPEAALRTLSELWCDEEHPVSDRCVTAARVIHRAEWDEHSRRTAHAIVVRCYAHEWGIASLNIAATHLVALRDGVGSQPEVPDATPAQPEAPADDVPADVLAKIASKGSVREIINSVGAHAAEVLASPALAKAYAARLCAFAAADDPRTDEQRMADATTKVIAKARTKATDTQG